FLYPGAAFAGTIKLADIGITERSFQGILPAMYTIKEKPEDLLPKRRADGNKGTFGKLLLVAGSEKMAGAALLCGESAYRMGAGMVKLVIPEKIREIVQERLPEALIQTYDSPAGLQEEEEALFLENSKWADAIAIGPGLSVCESGRRLLELAIAEETKPLVIDADGLNILSSNEQLMERLKNRCTGSEREKAKVILTPHMGELARLLGEPLAQITANETLSTIRLAGSTGSIVAGKSARTHVCEAEQPIFLNTAGNDRMATAGSGDVLTGMIAALLVQGMEPLEAAVAGVYLHACAGDAAAEKAGNVGIKASDIIAGLSLL
ncbi:MAG: NAD(P)H-hydrate dehydratase, partial [Lachnospiraceae bacterium]